MNRRLVTISATVAVAAVFGAGGALLGRGLAPSEAGAEPPATVRVPVLGPVGRGDQPPLNPAVEALAHAQPVPGPGASPSGPAAPGDAPSFVPSSSMPSSPVLGHVTLPVDDEGAPDLGAALVADVARTATEVVEEVPDVLVLDTEDASRHDECAPRTGEPDPACPDGLMGAVLAATAVDLWLYGSDSVHEPSHELPPYAVQCPAVETGPGAMPFGFAASAPGTVEMTYGPYGSTQTRTERLTLTEEQVADWARRLAATPPDSPWQPAVYFCTVLGDVEKYTSYTFDATITDAHGATARSQGHFRLPEDRVRPPAIIRPVGDGVLYTALAHKPGDEVRITYRVLEDGETPDCVLPGHRLPEPVGRRHAVVVTPLTEEYLAANGYLPGYTSLKSWFTTVPEGSTVLVCFSEFRQDRPTWQWHDAQWRTWTVVATPDYARPSVAADSVSLETAIAVARSLEREDIARLAERMREHSGDHDARLRALLQQIA